ncbi:MAG: hypothetical protein JXA14_10045 [Anaerolineae bacterium]|nr:hypothetical protein [Anaerolineae bacterium]
MTNDTPDLVARVHDQPFTLIPLSREDAVLTGDVWWLSRYGTRRVVQYDGDESFGNLPFTFSWEEDSSKLDIFAFGLREHCDLPAAVYALFKVPLGRVLGRRGGAIVHACGVSVREEGLLFVGANGAGKSTMASLWDGTGEGVILHDDMCPVHARDDLLRVFGVPWLTAAGFCSPGGVPLRAVFFIEHGTANRCTPLAPNLALPWLAQNMPALFWDEASMLQARETTVRIVESTPCYRLAFVPDSEVVPLVLEILAVLD